MANSIKVVFRNDVRGIAQAGDVKSVSAGYARNYLFPRQLAFVASDATLRQWETERQGWIAKAEHLRSEAKTLAQQIESVTVEITAKAGDEGKLFGSVSRQDILDQLAKQGLTLDKKTLHLTEPIKQLGTVSIPVRLQAGIQAQLKVNVVAEAQPA